MEDLPVQGPLPQEPDDAPFRKSETGGIRKLLVNQIYGCNLVLQLIFRYTQKSITSSVFYLL